jgi:anti-sigma factor RsiW
MNLSKNVIRDLLPAYVAGEASQETCELVKRALATDAELRRSHHARNGSGERHSPSAFPGA